MDVSRTRRDHHDVLGGLLMAAIGFAAAWYAVEHYELGSPRNMGPGFFPFGLGLLLGGLGVLIALPALLRSGVRITVAWRTLGCVIGALVLFGVLLKTAGLVLATVASVLLASLADRGIGWRTRLIAAAVIAALCWLIFIAGLNMVLPVWPWSR
ncbi:tripartite tricarboxylate transporter TctB family protein [Tepidimonas charontis]|uniref:Tripartite tricarboxylate transporter TctB family protein n=1 Tax=Tepidimonas charontis TaxID=2267262 RepID=A0A554XIC5_9BURK|nr:tripartite tricarboxylate transporter TctB family protein [Tepidimonas charontis]TSE35539.1 Tripartite tricarboxylate transporter TctB family protein [Tepidimonas charontis]